ncbi:restriction endonuclease subunit S [Spiroplasma endosymbiont of Polydrusus pterygomalis]|uniref:restriction endonuclease subunit S n=1 Tax=Spiroplasma endosymbiont of Polydrusus pterygomalis TaxID=3139327 RepID=UPI003CCAB8DB
MNKSLLPKIRFKGFNGEWVLKQIKALGNIKTGKTPSTKNEKNWLNDVLWITIPDMTKKYLTNSKKKISLMASKKNPVVKEKSILFSCIGTIGNIGITTTITSFNQQINSISSIKDVVEYVYYLFQYNTEKIKSYSLTQTLPMINKNYFENIEIFVSLNYKEQNKIADFFTIIDKKIELVKEQLSLLAKQKQYYLNNMFANEKSYPKIRFKGFNDEWENKKIGEILNYQQPTKFIIKDKIENQGKIPVLTANKSFVLGYVNEKNIYENIPVIIFDDFTMDMKYVNFKFMIKSSAIKILKSKNNNINLFYVFNLLKNLKLFSSDHKRYYISYVSEINVLFPNIYEQTKVAHFFTIIDRKIKLVKEQLSLLAKQKQYYLN